MNNSIQQIYLNKIRDIESRIPVKILNDSASVNNSESISFANILNDKMGTDNSDNSFKDIVSKANSDNVTDEINKYVNEASKTFGLDPDLIKSVINAESSFNPNSTSNKGAAGLMQLMPSTAKSLGVDNPYDIKENIMGGSKYLSSLIDSFGDVKLALASYNAGSGNVKKYGGIPPFKETQHYVAKIIKSYEDAKKSGI